MNTQKRDIFEMWAENGDLDRILDFIRDCSRKLVTQGEMCEHLGITETTFSKLKKKHPELQEAIVKSKLDLACFGHRGREDLNVPWEDVYVKAKEISSK